MEVKIQKTASTDRLFLVDAKKLMEYENDIACRNSQTIENVYHKDWFFEQCNFLYFTPPAAYIFNGKIFFINGRHRTILLSRYLNEFPFLIGNIDLDHFGLTPKAISLEVMTIIKAKDVKEHSSFTLPDLKMGKF